MSITTKVLTDKIKEQVPEANVFMEELRNQDFQFTNDEYIAIMSWIRLFRTNVYKTDKYYTDIIKNCPLIFVSTRIQIDFGDKNTIRIEETTSKSTSKIMSLINL